MKKIVTLLLFMSSQALASVDFITVEQCKRESPFVNLSESFMREKVNRELKRQLKDLKVIQIIYWNNNSDKDNPCIGATAWFEKGD